MGCISFPWSKRIIKGGCCGGRRTACRGYRGTFAIHDLMSKARYGDMEAFVQRLKDQGYEDVRLIDTTHGVFMNRTKAVLLDLSGSTLLVGRK